MYLIKSFLLGLKREKDSLETKTALLILGYSLNIRSVIQTVRVSMFFGDCVRFVSQKRKLVFSLRTKGFHLSGRYKAENLTNYAVTIFTYLCKYFNKQGDAISSLATLIKATLNKKPFSPETYLSTRPTAKRFFQLWTLGYPYELSQR